MMSLGFFLHTGLELGLMQYFEKGLHSTENA